MTNVLILGAHGQIARIATDLFLEETEVELTLYLRRAERLSALRDHDRVQLVEGDVLDRDTLKAAMEGQDVVYANLAGDLGDQARLITETMEELGLKRLIFVASMGIYDEVPDESFGSVLDPYRTAANVIEKSDLDHTILRPAWLNNRDEIDYETTKKGEQFEIPLRRSHVRAWPISWSNWRPHLDSESERASAFTNPPKPTIGSAFSRKFVLRSCSASHGISVHGHQYTS